MLYPAVQKDQLNIILKTIKDGSSIWKTGRDFLIPESKLIEKLNVCDASAMCPALNREAIFN